MSLLTTVRNIAATEGMKQTHEGGYAFEVGPLARLRRFLILGSASGSFYASAETLTSQNINAINAALEEEPVLAIRMIAEISEAGRAVKNDPAIFALALASVHPKTHIRSFAFSQFGRVCRTGSHVLMFASFREALGKPGMGRAYGNALTNWLYEREPRDLAYQLTKYQDRNGWKMTDLVASARPTWRRKEPSAGVLGLRHRSETAYLLDVIMSKTGKTAEDILRELTISQYGTSPVKGYGLLYLKAVQEMRQAFRQEQFEVALALVEEHRMPWEVIPSEALNSPKVWDALLRINMPMTAMIRNLGKMSKLGLFSDRDTVNLVTNRLTGETALREARIHPLFLLNAFRTYGGGKGFRGSLEWTPNAKIVDALEAGFYLSMNLAEPTGTTSVVAIDVSPSMYGSNVAGLQLDAAECAAVMAMSLVRQEVGTPQIIKAFTHQLVDLDIDAEDRLDDVLRKTKVAARNWGGTDATKPILWALETKTDVSAFITLTDAETMGNPRSMLQTYRAKVRRDARMVNVAMVANDLSLADPNDALSLDVVGFDTVTPSVIARFLGGEF